MVGKKCSVGKQIKRKAIRATIAFKKDLIAKHESGVRVCELASMFEMPKSTVCTIIKNKEAIKAADVAKGVTTLTTRRSKNMEEMEKLLLVWINEKQLADDVISEAIICDKAKAIHDDLIKNITQKEEFKASRGWYENFKKRSGIHNSGAAKMFDVYEKDETGFYFVDVKVNKMSPSAVKEQENIKRNVRVNRLKFKQKQPTGSKTDQISTNTQSVSSVPIEYKLETLEAADEPILEICDIKTEPEDSDSCGNSAQSIIKPVLDNSGAEQLSLNENIDPLNNCDTTYNTTSDNKNQNSSEDFFTDLSKNIIEQLKVFPLEHAIIMADKMQNFIAQERSKFKI